VAPLLFVAAGLQLDRCRRATRLEAPPPLLDPPALCPVCGAPPVASIVHTGTTLSGVRFLHCGLCASAWHLVRVKCTCCQSTKGIAYYHTEERDPYARGETCSECHHYLKIFAMERAPEVEALADDLATAGLDFLLTEAGWQRGGANPFFLSVPS